MRPRVVRLKVSLPDRICARRAVAPRYAYYWKMTRFTLLCLLTFVLVGVPAEAHATGDSLRYLRHTDTVYLQMNRFEEKIFAHRLAPGQTLGQLARFYGIDLADIFFYNPELQVEDLVEGFPVRVPIPNKAIHRYRPRDYSRWRYVPICYLPRRQDNLYRISKDYFKMPMDTLLARNRLRSGDALRVNQPLLVGWMKTSGIPYTGGESANPIIRKSNQLRKQFVAQSIDRTIVTARGASTWTQNGRGGHDLVVLHRKAAINSVVRIHHPMFNRTLYARVIGRIPPSTDPEVHVMVSPYLAQALGVRDLRFFTVVDFY